MALLLLPVFIFSAGKEVYKNDLVVKGDDEAHFKVELPEGWKVVLGDDLKLNILGEKKDGKAVCNGTIKIGFDVLKYKPDLPVEYIEMIKGYYKKLMDPKIVKTGIVQSTGAIGKYKGIKLEYQLNIGNSIYKYWQFMSRLNNEDIAIITCTAPTASFVQFEKDFQAIVETMDFEVVVK